MAANRAPAPIVWLLALFSIVMVAEGVGGWVNLLLICVTVTVLVLALQSSFRKEQRPKASINPTSKKITSPTYLAQTQSGKTESMDLSSHGTDTAGEFAALVPVSLQNRSGSVFYSGLTAFSSPSRLYILGLNPGGSPIAQSSETIARDIAQWKSRPTLWSAYSDESWEGRPPGKHGMQPRMLHMFKHLNLDPRLVPASNVVFVRSSTEATLATEKALLLAKCWPVHAAVIRKLGATIIVCLGGTAGRWVRDAVGANRLIDSFEEANSRGCKSQAHLSSKNFCVITVTHPGRADWRNSLADPSPLIKRMLER